MLFQILVLHYVFTVVSEVVGKTKSNAEYFHSETVQKMKTMSDICKNSQEINLKVTAKIVQEDVSELEYAKFWTIWFVCS
jgi:hypothetical protein